MSLMRRSVVVTAVMCVASELAVVKLNNGVEMPVVSLGTAGYKGSACADAVVTAVKAGMMGIDTANNYRNQKGVGQGLKRVNRSAVFVTTKTTPCNGISDVNKCAQHTRKELDADFSQLDLKVIDLVLLHGANHRGSGACSSQENKLNVAQWKVYEEYYKAGKIRAIGVSNYCPSCLEALKGLTVPAVNQVQYHVGMGADPGRIFSYCEEHGIVPQAYTPMGRGSVFKNKYCKQIGQAHGKTAAQVALKWISDKGYVLTTKTNKESHVKEDLDLFSWNITADETKQLDGDHSSRDKPSWACTSAVTTV